MAVRTMRAPVSAFLICASLYLGSAKTATPPATMAMIATTIKTSTSVTPRLTRFACKRWRMIDTRRDTSRGKNDRGVKLIPDDFVFMGSSSFNAVESTRFAVRPITGELIGFPFAMSRADETERVPPSVRRSIFEISITRELVESARAIAAVVRAKRIDRMAHTDQRRARLADAGAVAFSHAQDGDRADHARNQQHGSDAAEHEQAA